MCSIINRELFDHYSGVSDDVLETVQIPLFMSARTDHTAYSLIICIHSIAVTLEIKATCDTYVVIFCT
jgi:hypothetical protein